MTVTNFGEKEQSTLNQKGSICAVCAQHKYQLRLRRSKLSGHQMLVCNTCFENKYEPRWLIILVAQDEGIDKVSDYILNHKYVGPEIPAADLYK